MLDAAYYYIVRYWIAPAGEARVMAWLDGGHIAEVAAQPGFLWARRIRLEETDSLGWRAFANIYSPVAVPVIMNKQSKVEAHMVGRIAPGSAQHRAYQAELAAVEAEGFARWVRPS